MISILGAGCSTAAGLGIEPLMAGLHSGATLLSRVSTDSWAVQPNFEPRAYRWREGHNRSLSPQGSVRELLVHHLAHVLDEALNGRELKGSYGLLLASTKGFTEDIVWSDQPFDRDPLTPLLDDVIAARHLKPDMRLCVSNACASSLAALALAKTWLARMDHVIILACDAVDSFVLHGFSQLRVLTSDQPRPFAGDRSGFYLGDAAACVILSKSAESDVQLIDARYDSEGYAVTRPSHSGESLLRACRQIKGADEADLVVAHGTATRANDETEDRVFQALFGHRRPLITGTKWMIGHTLGTCGLIDVIVARDSLRNQKAPALMTTEHVDASFKSDYLTLKSREIEADTALVTSLGFGGVHAAALIGRS